MHLLVTRPEPDASLLAQTLRGMGHEAMVAPLMDIVMRDFALQLEGVQGVLFTSANGVRAFAETCGAPPLDLTAFTVGPASAQAARDAGWERVESADGDVAALADLVVRRCTPEGGSLVHISGKAAAGDLAGALGQLGFTVSRVVAYEARVADALPDAVKTALEQGGLDGVLLFSPRSARVFADLAEKAGLSGKAAGLKAYCLSQAVADVLKARISEPFFGPSSANCEVATAPETPHLLALLSP